MFDLRIQEVPERYPKLLAKCEEIGFTMPSNIYIGTLLKSLVTSKPDGQILELGTGIGLSLSWMIDGLDKNSKIISIDNDPELINIAREFFGKDDRVTLISTDGGHWIKNYQGDQFDLIFADAWPGKFYNLEETLELVKPGGFYIIDDMTPHPDWPEGHAEKAQKLTASLEKREDFTFTKMDWSTGVILCTRK